MNKIFILFVSFIFGITLTGCESLDVGPGNEGNPIIQTLKTEGSVRCVDGAIKFLDDKLSPAITYNITPVGFELDRLEEKGYYLHLSVEYDVYYKKDYDVLWDIGYAGAPKYEVTIANSDLKGQMEKDLSTSKSSKTRSMYLNLRISDIRYTKWTLTFSTDNVQNIIYFKNITVYYNFLKL